MCARDYIFSKLQRKTRFARTFLGYFQKCLFFCKSECLISEDCPNAEYCDLKTNLCKNACSLNGKFSALIKKMCIQFLIFTLSVCAPQAECKARIHRPLCFCPDGYEGNPHVECTKSPSRAGLRFKREERMTVQSFILQSSSP